LFLEGALMKTVQVIMALVPALAQVTAAQTFTVPLDVAGSYVAGQETPFEFDLGVELLRVQDVTFSCAGCVMAGVDCNAQPFSWNFNAYLCAEPGYLVAQGPLAGKDWYPWREPFEAESQFQSFLKGTCQCLFDGRAFGWVQMPQLFCPPGSPPPQELPCGQLDNASITIQADTVLLSDFDSDGQIGLCDFATFARAWRSTPADDNWNPRLDIAYPKDCIINERDLECFCRCWLR